MTDVPLVVDLDGTLIKSDTFLESLVLFIKNHPSQILKLPLWLSRGRGYAKKKVASLVMPDPKTLPYHKDVVSWLKKEKKKGRQLVLASGTDQKVAEAVAEHCGYFDEVYGSTEDCNLTGRNKAKRLCELYGEKKFDYAGNARVDEKVWCDARKAWTVSAPSRVVLRQKEEGRLAGSYPAYRPPILYARMLRVHQWAKNILLIAPIFFAHKIFQLSLLPTLAEAFFAFSFCSSAVYILNDILDLEHDRHHQKKKLRPFACGDLPMQHGLAVFPLLLILAFGLAWRVNLDFFYVILGYFGLTTIYSLKVKKIPLLDITFLAGLFTWRIIAGAVAVNVEISGWFATFSLFFFGFLAAAKRITELQMVGITGKSKTQGRGFIVSDLGLLENMAAATGYLSILVFALYINSTQVAEHYANPSVLWLITPILFYWISRMLFYCHRGRLPSDPVLFAIKDKPSYLMGGLVVAVVYFAI